MQTSSDSAGIRSWILAARPKTLPAAIAPVLAGGWLAQVLAGGADWRLLGFALASCLCLQVATNLFNDAIDFEKGADTEERIGPQRVTQSGLLTSRQVLSVGGLFLLIAAGLSVPLILERGWVILLIGIPSLYLCYGYTGGPAPLAYLGLGEIFVMLFFGLIAVTGSFFVASGAWSLLALVLGFQLGALSTTLICINNLRDREGDAEVGKRTLAVRFGQRFARWEISFLFALPYLLGGFWWSSKIEGAAWLPLLALPLALIVVRGVWKTPPSPAYNKFLALSALHLLVFSALVCGGMLL